MGAETKWRVAFLFFSDSNEVLVCEQLLIFLDLSFHRVRFIEREIKTVFLKETEFGWRFSDRNTPK